MSQAKTKLAEVLVKIKILEDELQRYKHFDLERAAYEAKIEGLQRTIKEKDAEIFERDRRMKDMTTLAEVFEKKMQTFRDGLTGLLQEFTK